MVFTRKNNERDDEKREKDSDNERSSTEIGQGGDTETAVPANIFSEGGKNYRTMGRWDTSLVLITNQVGIGILSLPSTMRTLGIVPGSITIIGLGLLSTYTAYELLQFYRKYPHVVNIVDMARVMGGKPFEIFIGICLMVQLVLTCASACVTMSVAFNTISSHAICTVGWMGIPALMCWLLCLPRSFKFVSYVGLPGAISIFAAVLTVMISLGIDDPKSAPTNGDWSKEINVVGNPTFAEGLNACLQISYAYAGNVGFVSYMAEMKNPSKDFVPGLVALQAFSIPMYLMVAIAIYCLSGQYVTSPALGSAPELPAKIAYGIAVPALLGTGLVFGHTAIKYLYVVIMRAIKATDQLTDRSTKSMAVWGGSATFFWVMSFILANAIPIFESILNISAATLIAWFTFGISSIFWFFLNKGRLLSTKKKTALTVANVGIILMSCFMTSAGLWSAVTDLLDTFNDPDSEIEGVFTCGDNSLF